MKVTYLNTLVCCETSVRESFLLPLLKPLQRICPLYPWYLSYNPSTKTEAKKSPFIFFLHCCLLGEDLDPNPPGILDIAIPTESTGIKAVQHLAECGLPIPSFPLPLPGPPKPRHRLSPEGAAARITTHIFFIVFFGTHNTVQLPFMHHIFLLDEHGFNT